MGNPVLRISLPIQRRALNINVLIRCIKIDISDRGNIALLITRHIDFREIRWG